MIRVIRVRFNGASPAANRPRNHPFYGSPLEHPQGEPKISFGWDTTYTFEGYKDNPFRLFFALKPGDAGSIPSPHFQIPGHRLGPVANV